MLQIRFFLIVSILLPIEKALASSEPPSTSKAQKHNSHYSIQLPGRPYETSWEEAADEGNDEDRPMLSKGRSWLGSGREFDLFDSRGGSSNGNGDGLRGETDALGPANDSGDAAGSRIGSPSASPSSLGGKYRRPSTSHPYASSSGSSYYSRDPRTARQRSFSSSPQNNKSRKAKPELFQTVQDWWTTSISPNVQNWPKIQCRVEPTTTLKIRKTFRPLKTIVRLGADFNTQRGVWQFKSSWEDEIIGGKLTLAGKELQLTKSWQLSVGAVEDLVTRLRFRAAIDLQTWKAYARVGFRTERLSPINVMEGFTLMKRIPMDGNKGNVKLEVKANFALPEPEIEYSTETQRSLVGMGDIEVSIDELNLLLDY